ncbi:MAG: pilus assembly protein PilA [Solimicrobium sp.]|jgi:type IV pilus assembly protein PilA|nr:pilus assembly protein PilA [Solimicrobium sp.]
MPVSQKGFTLIELMIVVVIIIVLAAIALPQYRQYMNKAKFTELIAAAAPHKIAVEMCSMEMGMDGMENCNSGQNGIAKSYVRDESEDGGHVGKIEVAEGIITITAAKKLGYTENPTYQLIPKFTDTSMRWVVGGSCREAELC